MLFQIIGNFTSRWRHKNSIVQQMYFLLLTNYYQYIFCCLGGLCKKYKGSHFDSKCICTYFLASMQLIQRFTEDGIGQLIFIHIRAVVRFSNLGGHQVVYHVVFICSLRQNSSVCIAACRICIKSKFWIHFFVCVLFQTISICILHPGFNQATSLS